ENIYQGGLSANKERLDLLTEGDEAKVFVEMLIKGGKLEKLAQLWVSGVEIEWVLLYGTEKPRRISLPTYPFAKEQYWIPNNEQNYSSVIPSISSGQALHPSPFVLHPLVHQNISDLEEQRFSSTFSGAEFFLNDHRVQGEKVLPGVAYLEMARAAGEMALKDQAITQFKDVVWIKPIIVKDEPVETYLGLYPAEEGEIAFEISSNEEIHSQGKLVVREVDTPEPLDIGAIQARCQSTVEGEECYRRFKEQGLAYGPSFQGMRQFSFNEQEALARLRLPTAMDKEGYGLHPGLLDAALQATLGLVISQTSQGQSELYLPFAVQEVNIYAELSEQGYAYVQYSPGVNPMSEAVRYDITLTDEQGQVCVDLQGFTTRAIIEPDPTGVLYSTPDWQSNPLLESDDEPQVEPVATTLFLVGLEQEVVETITTSFDQAKVIELETSNVTALVQQSWQHLKAIVKGKPQTAHQILVVASNTVEAHRYVPLAGLLKTTRLEQHNIWGKVITISPAKTETLISLLKQEMSLNSFQDVTIRYDEKGTRSIKTLREIELNNQAETAYLKPGGVYWITGGMGGLGRIFARHFINAASLTGKNITIILTSRSALDEAGKQQLAELNEAKATVVYLPADVSVKSDVERVVQAISEAYGPLTGIIHSAGVIRDSFIINKTEAELEAVLAPKVTGLLNIDAVTQAEKLDFMVLFSSMAGVLGNIGQADYAAANAFVDAFAHHRQALVEVGQRSGRTLSINWSLWAEGGMAVDEQTTAWLKHQMGLTALETSTGIRALTSGLSQPDLIQLLVTSGDRQKIRKHLQKIDQNKTITPNQTVELTPAQQSHLFQVTETYLKEQLSTVLKLPSARMEHNAPWERYGIDSVMVLNLTRQLEQTFGELPKTLFFEYLTLTDLTRYFVETYSSHLQKILEPANGPTKAQPQTRLALSPNSARSRWLQQASPNKQAVDLSQTEDIAIVGLSGRYPLAENLTEFWKNLKQGRDCIREIPQERWDYRSYYDPDKDKFGKSYSKWGGFMVDVDKFDPLFFNISPREAEFIDPQERLFLQTVWQTLEDASYTRQTLQQQLQSRVGVFVGVMWGEYQLYGQEQISLSSSYASIANRVSYYLNLHGPSLAVDTMCSSSLTAIHLACESIKRGECVAALAGGVNVSIHPNKYLQLSQGKFAASDGRCRSFGEGGDGYVPGEGVGAVLLKPLAQAQADGDQIYGVIKGSSVNHGGKTHGYTVPNPNAQGQLIAETLQKSGVRPESISYVEVHGTGTALGDPIEIRGLSQAFGDGLPDNHTCIIGSVKSNIGHLESAAGIAGLTKVLLQMKHQQLVPSLHSKNLNPHIDFEATPFNVQRELTEWKRPIIEGDGVQREYPRRAGLSSFGAGGANTHLIVEEYWGLGVRNQESKEGPQLIVLSARNEERLREYAVRLLAYLEINLDILLTEMAYTLQVGREAMEARLAVVVFSVEELVEALSLYEQKQTVSEGFYRGNTRKSTLKSELLIGGRAGEAFSKIAMDERDLDRLAQLWVSGVEIPWALLYPVETPNRISLPTYPFARERYWIPTVKHKIDRGEIARLGLEDEPTGSRKMVLLAKEWVATQISQNKRADHQGRVAILATVKTRLLAEEL
ncbi:MAG: SDR family NAD(P)-dependent oxidoreductase, partial [Gammaproteobacteria bacterium]|nr:SDR family NAD(P)-dependent oxidoreductase [Gammaproteobacteria bacterium]